MGNLSILEKDVIQANPLIRAKKEMNLTEMRLFVLGLQDIKPHITDDVIHDVEFHETIISHTVLTELFGTDNNGNIANLKKQAEKAYDNKIILSYKDGGFGFRHIYQKMDYIPNKGLLIKFDDEIKPYILEIINQAYTKYKVKAFFSLSSVYAWRLLESLLEKQGYLKQGHKEIFLILTIEEVRFRLNVPDGKYEGRINNFRKYVLDEPIKEINDKTDYFVWYEVQKTGRKVTGFKFWLKLKKAAETVETIEENPSQEKEIPAVFAPASVLSDKDALKAAMEAEGMSKAAINTWLKKYGVEGAAASWRLAVEHANSRTETQHKGTQRKKYIKACMERNIAYTNNVEAELKAEIDEREKRAAEEKKQAIKAMQEGFKKIGFASPERKGSDLESTGSMLGVDVDKEELEPPQEISKERVKTIVSIWKNNDNSFPDALIDTLKNYGYTPKSFTHKYWRDMLG